MLDVGINNASISYEVALESLGSRLQPFVQALHEEKKKENPSQVLIDYYNNRISALDDLREDLRPEDTEVIKRILTIDKLI
jgi:hypothetical protein